ncbi:MAG: chemotaxis-specific protein-glutamate methyltransferase CheB [Gammaproteobacteria bacterium]
MIRVLLVDDSPIALHILRGLLAGAPDIKVVGTASNGKEALNMLPSVRPDVLCTDLHMPVMNGLELTREVMTTVPLPILVISVSVEPGSPNVFNLLEAGAVDVYSKPGAVLESHRSNVARELASKIRIVAGVHVFRYPKSIKPSYAPPTHENSISPPIRPAKIVAIGASTGGPQALRMILSALPKSFPLPIVCVQHIGSDFLVEMLHWLAQVSHLPIRAATEGELPQAGKVYFAPGDAHLELDAFHRFSLSQSEPFEGHRPSVTVTMRALARCFGAHTIGILLTGMGRDGADGMVDIAVAGGITIAQDEASSIVYGMPHAAVTLGAAQHVLPLELIAPTIISLVTPGNATHNRYSFKET